MKKMVVISALAATLVMSTSAQSIFHNLNTVLTHRPHFIRVPQKRELIPSDFDCNTGIAKAVYQAVKVINDPTERNAWMNTGAYILKRCRKTMPVEQLYTNNINYAGFRIVDHALNAVLTGRITEESKREHKRYTIVHAYLLDEVDRYQKYITDREKLFTHFSA
ncbi:MAG: hypothetical protein ACHQVS_01670 [Candidatus Babeliales bacterium]